MIRRYKAILLIVCVGIFLAPEAHAQEEVTLTPAKDNTLYQDPEGDVSNGAGDHLFAGRTGARGSGNRRALLAFDVSAAVPGGAQIDSVVLHLEVSMDPPVADPTQMTLHRAAQDWGESSSDAAGAEGAGTAAETNDATWLFAFYDSQAWDSEGGDFRSEASATFSVAAEGEYSVGPTDEMTADVQSWIDNSEENYGWIIVGDESTSMTARRFDSREHSNADRRPQLTIYYTESTSSERENLPQTLVLAGNHPNPFTESTTIQYEVEKAQNVRIELFDMTGREVMDLDRGLQVAGPHALDVSADGLAAGPYVYCLSGSASGRDCRTMVVLP